MYPYPLEFLGVHIIRSYGLMLAIAFFFGIIWARKRAIRAGIPADHVIDLSFIVLLSSVVGSRLFYVIFHMDEFSDNLLAIINPFHGGNVGISGLSMMGGVVLALISAVGFFKIKKINPWPLCDAMMPMFALGLGIARIGCFLNGCCYGMPSDGHFGLAFPPDSAAGFHFPGVELIPTQLYSSLAGFAIATIVLFSEKFKKFDGHSFWLTIFLYGLWRFFIDYFRWYEDSMIFHSLFNLTRNQFLSLLLSFISLVAFIIFYRKNKLSAKTDAKTGSK